MTTERNLMQREHRDHLTTHLAGIAKRRGFPARLYRNVSGELTFCVGDGPDCCDRNNAPLTTPCGAVFRRFSFSPTVIRSPTKWKGPHYGVHSGLVSADPHPNHWSFSLNPHSLKWNGYPAHNASYDETVEWFVSVLDQLDYPDFELEGEA